MSTNDNSSSKKEGNEDILKSFRHLGSCITLTSVKDAQPGSKSPSSSSEGSSEELPDLTPSALRGISIQGSSKGAQSILSDLLSKKNTKKKEEEEESSRANWISEWSKRCLSISFSSKTSGEAETGEPDEAVRGGARLENGTPPSSASSASNSRDSFPGNKLPPTTITSKNTSISIRPVADVAKSSSVTVFKSKSQHQQQQSDKRVSESKESRPDGWSGVDPPRRDSKDSEPNDDEEEEEGGGGEEEEEGGEEEEEEDDEGEEEEGGGEQDPLKDPPASKHPEPKKQLQPEAAATPPEKTAAEDRPEDIPPEDKITAKEAAAENPFQCSFCLQSFLVHSDLIAHIPKCKQLGCSVSFASQPSTRVPSTASDPVARKKTNRRPSPSERLSCVRCRLRFHTWKSFETHHLSHVTDRVEVLVKRCVAPTALPNYILEGSEDSDSRGSSTGSGSRSGEDKGLKLTFKISNVKKHGRGRRTKVQIVSAQEMNEGSEDRGEGETLEESPYRLEEDSDGAETLVQPPLADADKTEEQLVPGSAQENRTESGGSQNATMTAPNSALPATTNSEFGSFNSGQLNFGSTAPNERPPSTYQPQFESFPGDWFSEYESGSRIAAAMTGASSEGAGHSGERPAFNSNSSGSESGYGTEDPRARTSPYAGSSDTSSLGKEVPPSSANERDGLFSQAVLGGEPTPGADDARQGSFEQLCLNDSFGQTQQDSNLPQPGIDQNYQHSQPYHSQQGQGAGGDLLSELAYLNNNGQQIDPAEGVPPMEGDRPYSSHSSNSGTPTSSGHPTPPPTDTSFRALATSPLNSPSSPLNSGGPTPPVPLGTTPPMPSTSSPLQQMGQMGQPPMQQPMGCQSQDAQLGVSAPRLTIANNLMPTTTTNAMGPVVNTYGQQWGSASSSSQQNFPSSYMQSGAMATGLGSTLRPPVAGNLPIGYRPSPPPRIRGRPPLMGHVGRPPMMRGPGRPPGSSTLPPLIAAPGGATRGAMMPSLQRLPQYGSGQRQTVMGTPQKRPAGASVQSPNKSLRREDINVPSRQKDNECQIIAVANRTGDGMPVIANVQGGREEQRPANRTSPSTASGGASTSESTIHLNDSITLSVRSNTATRDATRTEKGGDAGVVANLLASRGITVAPAAGEKEGSANGGREERRLPTASDLNLSSAISVHPPTSRDRDGFAVPHPPSAKGTSSSSSSSSTSSSSSAVNNPLVDRPPRPPTVDLTQEISTAGAQGTRLQCHQCDRTFPTQPLLSDHAKVHQQQAQTRMPFKCHLCTAGFSSQKGQQHHYQQFHQLHLSAGDLAIPVVDFRNPVNVQRMARLGIRSFLPLSNLQNRGAGGVVGIPILSLENLHNGQMNLQQWGITDVLTLGPPRTMNVPR